MGKKGSCVYCSRYFSSLTKEHPIPQKLYKSLTGFDLLNNNTPCVYACDSCNNIKSEFDTIVKIYFIQFQIYPSNKIENKKSLKQIRNDFKLLAIYLANKLKPINPSSKRYNKLKSNLIMSWADKMHYDIAHCDSITHLKDETVVLKQKENTLFLPLEKEIVKEFLIYCIKGFAPDSDLLSKNLGYSLIQKHNPNGTIRPEFQHMESLLDLPEHNVEHYPGIHIDYNDKIFYILFNNSFILMAETHE